MEKEGRDGGIERERERGEGGERERGRGRVQLMDEVPTFDVIV